MSVLLETTAGDLVIDLLVDYAPKLCENFLKLCKVKYYNFAPIHSVQKSFSFQTGDPLGPFGASGAADGGTSIWGLVSSDPADKTFPAFFHPKLKHLERGTVSMATAPQPGNPEVRVAGSQFIVTLADRTDHLDGKAAIFARVVEGFDVLEKINDAIVDADGHPFVDIRIKHTIVLDDPYPDPVGLREPSGSPPPTSAQIATIRLTEDEAAKLAGEADDETLAAAAEKARRDREARTAAAMLTLMGDLPHPDVKPPENVLFVCKLNPATQDEDLELIFSSCGEILSCEIIRDEKTGDSLQYAFIEFKEKSDCEKAYFKMQNVLIDDRRIHVDFSQSVSKLWQPWKANSGRDRRGWKHDRQDGERAQGRRGGGHDHGRGYKMVYGAEEMQGRHESSRAHQRGDEKRSGGRRDGGYRGERDDRRDRDRGARPRSRSPRKDRHRQSVSHRDSNESQQRDRGRDKYEGYHRR